MESRSGGGGGRGAPYKLAFVEGVALYTFESLFFFSSFRIYSISAVGGGGIPFFWNF